MTEMRKKRQKAYSSTENPLNLELLTINLKNTPDIVKPNNFKNAKYVGLIDKKDVIQVFI